MTRTETAPAPAPTLPRPVATRLRRPGWRDPRLLLGLTLVAASVVAGSWAVSSAARTVPVYAAERTVVPGQPVDAGALVVREVRLDAAQDAYLRADEALPEGLVAERTVEAGELVPRSALTDGDGVGLRPVALPGPVDLPEGLAAGATVDLWFVPAAAPGESGPASDAEPRLLAGDLTVAEVAEPDGFSVGSAATVHVLVPVEVLPDVLAARAADGQVEVVLVPGL